MKFEEYEYVRPDEKKILARMDELEEQFKNAPDYQTFKAAFDALDDEMRDLATASNLASIRHTIDTTDPYYKEQQEFFDSMMPVVQARLTDLYKEILASKFKPELEQEVAGTWFKTIENTIASISPLIVEDMQQENKVSTEYSRLLASAQIPFDGKVYTLEGLSEKMNDPDRKVRERAHKAYWDWFAKHEEQIGDYYDQLVHIRDKMAKKLGFENYIPLGYLRMNRLDYDQNDVEGYRKNVLEDVVPAANALYEKQKERLGADTLKVWDEKVEFTDGNARPHFDRDTLVDHALTMYKELDEDTGKFFQFMVDHDLMDLDSKPGKEGGGYCTFIPGYGSPFIFANFNKTQNDAEVLTHEAGHAFQSYCSQDIKPFDCVWPTMESAEIDSMSMEFFTWPWMELFFEDDADKFRYAHLQGAIKFIPYGVLVDHFQHEVYAHPDMTPKERMDTWRRLEKQYLPHKDYEGIDFLERGGWWMRQHHIFEVPFYYIDYTLAQVCALQFWKRMQDKDPKAFEDYKKICRVGGTLPFKQIVETAGLKVPFEPGCLKDTMEAVNAWYDEHPADFS